MLGHRQCSTTSLAKERSKHLENIAIIPLEDSVSFTSKLMPYKPRLGAEDHTCRHGITNACLPWRQSSAAAADADQSGFSPVYVLSLLLPDAASPPMARATQTSRHASTHLAITPFSEGHDQPSWLQPKFSTTKEHLQTPHTIILQAVTTLKRMVSGGPSSARGDKAGLLLRACDPRGDRRKRIPVHYNQADIRYNASEVPRISGLGGSHYSAGPRGESPPGGTQYCQHSVSCYHYWTAVQVYNSSSQ